ncbi:MAG: RNA polymerase sigma factor [Roseibium sp.]|nr:RNA polymerase sigma factor [Roseibium sp.]
MSWIDDACVLRRRALRLTKGNQEDAEDLLSATLIKAVSHVQRHATDVREPRAFLLFAMKNEHISRLRRQSSERQVRDFHADVYQDNSAGLSDTQPDQEHTLRHQDALRQVLGVVSGLAPELGEVFQLRFCEDCTYREIASRLAISEPLARKRVQHLRDHLRKALGDEQLQQIQDGRRLSQARG